MQKQIKCELVRLTTVYELAAKLSEIIKQSGFRPDIIVAISRGGFVPARLLCDFLNIRNMASVQVSHYLTAADKSRKAMVINPVNADLKGKNVLLVDDVNDSGDSLITAREHLEKMQVNSMKTAVIHEKSNTVLKVDFVAEYIIEWRWIIYQWAAVEDVGRFLQEINPSSLNEAQKQLKFRYNLDITTDEIETITRFLDPPMKLDKE